MGLRLEDPWLLPGIEIARSAAPSGTGWIWDRVARPPPDVAAHVQEGGLKLTDARVTDATLFAEAAAAIGAVPSLAAIVATRVGVVHLLRADTGYDVSHSEPIWADRIFISVPGRNDQVGALRLAEGVIHEALHLHLTGLEGIAPLVEDLTGVLPSPWRSEPRSFGGVLHGAFVFVGLKAYFEALPERLDAAAACHLRQRRAEIAGELFKIDVEALKAGLTKRGTALVTRLADGFGRVGAER